MKIEDALQGVARLFLDTAPVIYFVKRHPTYFARTETIFDQIDADALEAVTSPITLAECLVIPYRTGALQLQQDFMDLITTGHSTVFTAIAADCARHAAELRAQYKLTLTDALQVAVALGTGCDAFLTNDAGLRKVNKLRILVLDDLSL